jgi:hypothetical protein
LATQAWRTHLIATFEEITLSVKCILGPPAPSLAARQADLAAIVNAMHVAGSDWDASPERARMKGCLEARIFHEQQCREYFYLHAILGQFRDHRSL